jgi:hypothetical protein
MGLIMNYLKRKHGDKWWIWLIDWSIELAMLAGFIYLSWNLRTIILTDPTIQQCLHPKIPMVNLTNVSKT